MVRRHKLDSIECELVESDIRSGYKAIVIARKYGISNDTVYQHRHACGIPKRRWAKWTDGEDELIRKHYPEHGAAWREWAWLLPNREHANICKRASMLGVRYCGRGSKKPS